MKNFGKNNHYNGRYGRIISSKIKLSSTKYQSVRCELILEKTNNF